MRTIMGKRLALCFAALLLGCAPALAAPSRALLMVWNTAKQSNFKPHIDLAEALKKKRNEGWLKGTRLEPGIKLLDFGKADQAITCKRLGLTLEACPYLCIITLNGKVPVAVQWKVHYARPDDALAALSRKLGLSDTATPPTPPDAPATPDEPDTPFTPVPDSD